MTRRPRPCLSALTAAGLLAWTGGATAQSLEVGASVNASSAWLVRGITLNRAGTPVAFATADVYAAEGWSVGGLLGRMEAASGEWATPVNLRAGYEWSFGGRWTLIGQLRHLNYQGAESLKLWCYNEAGASLADGDRWVLSWSAETRRGPGCNQHGGPVIVSRSLELNASQPLDGGVHLGAGLGRRMYGGGQGYLYGQVGAGWRHRGLRVLLDRVWVSDQARLIYGDGASERWVGSVGWTF
jgi:hypothetical protein